MDTEAASIREGRLHGDHAPNYEHDTRSWWIRSVHFLMENSVLSTSIKLAAIAFCLLLPGLYFYFYQHTTDISQFSVAAILLSSAFTLGGFAVLMLTLHSLIALLHHNQWFYNSDLFHYVSELQVYVALLFWGAVLLVLINSPTALHRWIFSDRDLRLLLDKIVIASLLLTSMLAIKSHFMKRLAMSFNYSNYRDRIQECLFAERILQCLLRARHAYKFRRKWRKGNLPASLSGKSTVRRLSGPDNARQPLPSMSSMIEKATFPMSTRRKSLTDRDFTELSIDVDGYLGMGDDSEGEVPGHPIEKLVPPSSRPSPSHSDGEIPSRSPQQGANIPPISSTSPLSTKPITESDKKRQFAEFFRLANKTIAQFDVSGSDYRVETSREARRIAQKLFKWLKPSARDFLIPADFQPYIDDVDELRTIISRIRRRGDTLAITEKDLTRMIDEMLSDRYGLAMSMQSIEMALDKVDLLFTLLVILVTSIMIAMAVTDAVQLLLALSTMLSGAAFAFGTSAKNMFESIIFLLVIHPFDVGDRVLIALNTSLTENPDNLIVAEMHLLSTIFERWDGVKVYVPNHILAQRAIFNIRRSGPLIEMHKINIDFSTSVEKVALLRSRLVEWTKKETVDFTSFARVNLDSVEDCTRLNVNILIQHVSNWQDFDLQMSRKSKVVLFLKGVLEELRITYYPPVQRVMLIKEVREIEERKVLEIES